MLLGAAANDVGSEGILQLVVATVGLLLVALGVALVDSAGCDGVGVVVVADRVIQYSRTLGNPQSDLTIYYRVLGAVGHRYDR